MVDEKILAGKVVLVAGAGRPLGRILATGFARAGAKLALHDLSPVPLDETARMVSAEGAENRSYTAEVGKGLPARALIAEVMEDWGRLDVLVTCMHAAPAAALLDLDEWDWVRTLELNLTAPFLLAQAATDAMQEQGGGALIFVQAGTAGRLLPALTASQAGLVGLARAAALDLLPHNIHSFTLAAGDLAAWEQASPTGAAAQELQALAVKLCLPEAASLNGQVVFTGRQQQP